MHGQRSLLLALLVFSMCIGCFLTSPSWAAGAARRTLTVAAAASLTEFMAEAGPAFEKAHPGVKVDTSLASSSVCRLQIEQGAPVDIFMSADQENMNTLKRGRLVKKTRIFAHNRLAIMVGKNAKHKIRSLADLAKPGLDLVITVDSAPIGKYTRQMLKKADKSGDYGKGFEAAVMANVVSLEPNVKATLARVLLGDGDASICYATDITPDVRKAGVLVEIPDEVNVIASYPIGLIARSKNQDLAQKFMDFVASKQGQELLKKYEFLP